MIRIVQMQHKAHMNSLKVPTALKTSKNVKFERVPDGAINQLHWKIKKEVEKANSKTKGEGEHVPQNPHPGKYRILRRAQDAFFVDSTSTYEALLGRDWIHQSPSVPSTLHQQVAIYHEDGETRSGFWEMVEAESRPFLPTANVAEANFCNPRNEILQCWGVDENGRPTKVVAIRSLIKRLLVYGRKKKSKKMRAGNFFGKELEAAIQMAECVYNLDGPENLPKNPKLVEFLCAKPDKPQLEVQDLLKTIDLGTKEDPRPIQISGLLEMEDQAKVVSLLHEFKDSFAWHYTEMPGLDSTLVEHRMPIKEGYKPVKQAPRRMSNEIEEKVKEVIERLVKVGFIKPVKYVEWLVNIVPVLKAITKAVRCCVDYRNINGATLKDEYPMPIADLSIDAVAKHNVLFFMDGNASYNQIKMARKDIHKTTFRCPGHVGAYEYLVMPFRLKNIGATYQRAMNAIFHDLISHSMEYVPQRVIKGKAITNFLVEHQESQYEIINVSGTLEVASMWISSSKALYGKEEWIQQEIKIILGDTLWAYRTSKRAATGTTLYALTFGQDSVIPMEINLLLKAIEVLKQKLEAIRFSEDIIKDDSSLGMLFPTTIET
ncbi:S2-RNase [Pyrus ussuriensis x Pyrus communis]|uniref:S2-RNase n=1 Tax=Pyrus ussuriensis x Pyrus communis TaxID=2448454 RepID=A0A5N5HC17_9ROSA|nr:S2-RNase [Pyrus ussuriensis x Pyrus communis]